MKCFQIVCYVVLKPETEKEKKLLEKKNVINTVGKTNEHNTREDRASYHDKSSREYALALEMFYSDSIYDICGAS